MSSSENVSANNVARSALGSIAVTSSVSLSGLTTVLTPVPSTRGDSVVPRVSQHRAGTSPVVARMADHRRVRVVAGRRSFRAGAAVEHERVRERRK